ncbi:cAMP-dependent protein kinase catalytic subunit 1-like [Microplitis demolitor]|uniref:cAMP-dependent protein kinase catalytic subunit 1-like n=1 Tax=Microplitis demolitor TaxID=69319 RepID=UPI0006D5210D|nr:cAMP-dependent protein kinase catalytic subunit 1-like [Microplitis demolitor]
MRSSSYGTGSGSKSSKSFKSKTSTQDENTISTNINNNNERLIKSFKDYQLILDSLRDDFNKKWKVTKVKQDATLNDFDVLRTLGMGAFGRVKLIKNKQTSVYYAMKILDKRKIVKTKQVEHTRNEKRVLQSINYPFVVTLKYFFKDNSYLYMVLPFINGGELFSYLRRKGKFTEKLSKFYAAQVLLTLEYLHYCGLVYRDLKPENILISSDGYLKITDFGFCKLIQARTWTLCGTPEYIAPEIILSKGYGKSVDWWSFGVLIYEMTAGYAPFYSKDPMKIYEKIVSGKFKFPAHFSDDLKDIINNLLQVDLTRRYGNLKDGVLDIKNHVWFRATDWDNIYNKKLKASYIPVCKNEGDASNFDFYNENSMVIESKDLFAKEFADF